MKCVICELDFDYYDESKQCLHCWCISHNMPCECSGEKVPLCFQEPPAISKTMKKYWANQKKKGEKVPLCFQEDEEDLK